MRCIYSIRILVLGALPSLLAACHSGGSSAGQEGKLPSGRLAALHGTWLLLPEASHADTLAYRRNTYRFHYRPGGRPGFRLGPAGRFTRYDLAPGGGLLAQEGTWTEVGTDRLRIQLPDLQPAEPTYTLALLGYRDGLLLVQFKQDK